MTRQLVPFFGRKILTEIKPQDMEDYRAQRVRSKGKPVSLPSVNHDHVALKHCFNLALKRGLLSSNSAAKVTIPNPRNERDRVLSEEEWGRLYKAQSLM